MNKKIRVIFNMEPYLKPHHSTSISFTASSIFVVFLFLTYFSTQCYANVLCYVCVWMSHNTGVVSDERIDTCRPGKMVGIEPLVESCPNGCFINVIHQSEPEPERIGNRSIQQWSNCTENSVLMNMKEMNMTMYKRTCSDKQVHRDYCQVTQMVGFREEKRYCRTDYCNGDNGSASLYNTQSTILVVILLLVIPFLLTQFAISNSIL